jgi:diguanylate cyclase (GGDEF)-like protein
MATSAMQSIAQLTIELQRPHTLEEVLRLVVNRAAPVLGVEQASLRVLDATRTRLLVGCRTGQPVHENALFEFRVGEGLVGWVAQENRPLRLARMTEDPRYLPRTDRRVEMQSFVAVPLSHEGHVIAVLSATAPDENHFTAEHEQLLVLLAGLCAPYIEIARLARLPYVDTLTGTLNQAGLDQTLPEFAGDSAGPLSIAVVDVDGLRKINETLGEAYGDELLRTVGQTLAGSLRVGDAVARYGGDEFLLLTPNVSRDTAARIFDRARKAVQNATMVVQGRTLHATVSVGVAERHGNEGRPSLVRRAEQALLSAKKKGGNCVRVAIED